MNNSYGRAKKSRHVKMLPLHSFEKMGFDREKYVRLRLHSLGPP